MVGIKNKNTMNKLALTLFIALFSLSSTLGFAQRGGKDGRPPHDDRFEEIQTIKIGYITQKLKLTADQAKAFWPIYDEYEQKRRQLFHKFISQYKNDHPNGNPRDAKAYIDANISFQEEKLDLMKVYTAKLKKVLSDQQIADLYKAERDFKEMLLKRLQKDGAPPPPPHDR